MKILLINGSPHKEGCTHAALQVVAESLSKHGIVTEKLWLETKPVVGCTACGGCRKTGECVYDDFVNVVASKIDEYEGIIVGSPVYYAGISGQLKSFLDRLFFVCGSRMRGKVAAGVVSCRRGGASAAFDDINKYFLMSNMYVVGSQYWNQVHGTCSEEVVQDAEGVQTMQTLGENMAYLLRALDLARQAGVPSAKAEKVIRTNFIR